MLHHNRDRQKLAEEYIENSESEVDIDLSDNEDSSSKCSCLRILSETIVQFFILKPLKRHNG